MKKKIVEKQPEPSLLEKSIDVFKKIDLAEKRRALKTIRKAWQEGNVLDAAEPIAGMTAELFCTLYLLNRKQRPSKRKVKLDGTQACMENTPIPSSQTPNPSLVG